MSWPRNMIIVTAGEKEQIERAYKIPKEHPSITGIPFVKLRDGNWGVEEYTYSHDVYKGSKGLIERGASGLREIRSVDKGDTTMFDEVVIN